MKESIKITYLLFAEYLLSAFPLGTSMPETEDTIRRQALLAKRSLKTFTMDFPNGLLCPQSQPPTIHDPHCKLYALSLNKSRLCYFWLPVAFEGKVYISQNGPPSPSRYRASASFSSCIHPHLCFMSHSVILLSCLPGNHNSLWFLGLC